MITIFEIYVWALIYLFRGWYRINNFNNRIYNSYKRRDNGGEIMIAIIATFIRDFKRSTSYMKLIPRRGTI